MYVWRQRQQLMKKHQQTMGNAAHGNNKVEFHKSNNNSSNENERDLQKTCVHTERSMTVVGILVVTAGLSLRTRLLWSLFCHHRTT